MHVVFEEDARGAVTSSRSFCLRESLNLSFELVLHVSEKQLSSGTECCLLSIWISQETVKVCKAL